MADIDNDVTYPVETSIADTDQFVKIDKGDDTVKKTAWTVFKSTLKTYLDTLYHPLVSTVAAQFWLSGAGGTPSATAGCASAASQEMPTNDVNFKTLDFDKDTQEHAEWTHAMPSDYGGGTVTAVFHWTANSTSTNSVIWGLQARCFTDDDALDQAFGTAQEVTDANKSSAYDLNVTAATSAITIAGTPAAGKLVQWKAYRKAADGSDDLAVDAKLIGIQITYTRA